VVVTGFAEAGLGAKLFALMPTVPPLVAENWPLIPTAALLAHAAVFLGNDSGLTHLAATLGRPTVAVFGPTDANIWGPRGPHVSIVRTDERPDSSPDGGWSLYDPVGIQQVVAAAQRWLSANDLRQSPGGRSEQS
jgi:heptosyltransferase III